VAILLMSLEKAGIVFCFKSTSI